jgi:phenylpropionate dioxygenase-like ring-hydroxylating dioxygenase large terminal subunit
MLQNPDVRPTMPTIDADEVDRRLAEGWTLPAGLYTSPAVADVEDRLVWRPAWHLVGTLADFREPGDYITTHLASKYPILVTRDAEGELHGFFNVCRHRGALLLGGESGDSPCGHGNAKRFRCMYHGWTYGLDGRLLGAPDFRDARLPPFEELGLVPVSVDTWAGLVFASIEPEVPLSAYVAGMEAEADRAGYTRPFLGSGMEFLSEWEFTIKANWKLVVENNLECYHCAVTHADTLGAACAVDAANMGTSDFDNGNRIFTSMTDGADACLAPEALALIDAEGAATSEDPFQQYWLWPGSLFTTAVLFGDAVFRIEPIDPGTTRFAGRSYSRPGEEQATREKLNDFLSEFVTEDIGIAAGVQIGLESGARDVGPLLYGRERTISWCSELIWRHLSPAFR